MSSTPRRKVYVELSKNTARLRGATALISDVIKDVAGSNGLEYKWVKEKSTWEVSGDDEKIGSFISELQKRVSERVEIIVTKEKPSEEKPSERPTEEKPTEKPAETQAQKPTLGTFDKLARAGLALSLLLSEVVALLPLADKLSEEEVRKLRDKINNALIEIEKLLTD